MSKGIVSEPQPEPPVILDVERLIEEVARLRRVIA